MIDLMKEVSEDRRRGSSVIREDESGFPDYPDSEDENADKNPGGSGSGSGGYHSDSDSTVMMSGNSPFISKDARYNFLQRSGEFRKRVGVRFPGLGNWQSRISCEKLPALSRVDISRFWLNALCTFWLLVKRKSAGIFLSSRAR